MEIVRFDDIESSQISLGLFPKVFDPVDVISTVGEGLGMGDADVTNLLPRSDSMNSIHS